MQIDFDNLLKKQNLLAFSGGTDSSALFFMLMKSGIEFDIAIVDYGLREESKLEIKYAQNLAQKYKKKIYTTKSPTFNSNLEKNMRDFRYNFFDTLMRDFKYDNLITAHHLNDRLEWFLMRLGKGAGIVELMGFDEISKRYHYNIIRPLIYTSKDEILEFIKSNDITHFIDSTNSDIRFERNYIRSKFATPFIQKYQKGIKKSFKYLSADKKLFEQPYTNIKKLYIFKSKNDIIDIRVIDKILKMQGLLISSSQKDEILSTKDCVIGGKIAISYQDDKVYIAPFIKHTMSKQFKEKCRVSKIPPKIRGYLAKEDISISLLERS